MCVQVQGESNQVHVSGTLTVAEQSTLYTLGTSHLCQFSCSNSAATVVMRVD